MSRVLLINASEPAETRAALVAAGRVEEYRCDRAAAGTLVGNIYRGRVVNLEHGIGAAFVDCGVGRNGFLHLSACVGADEDTVRIDDLLAVGDTVVVQVTRDCVGDKGCVLNGDVSLPGRYVVLLPYARAGGVSRRIEDDADRNQLRALARKLEEQAGAGVIVRTAGADRPEEDLLNDLDLLQGRWRDVAARAEAAPAPALLYADSDLVVRAIRDLVDPDVEEIVVDTPAALERARTVEAGLDERLRLHDSAVPLFHAFDIERQIDGLRSRHVALPGGGSIVFDRTEALVAVDVNSGRTREESGLEDTALRTNLEAADAIARQLRLRNLGGVIVVDFIDMREASNEREVERVFKAALARDRARVRPGRMGPFGIFALTRRRPGAGGVADWEACPRCGGAGAVASPHEIALRVLREALAVGQGGPVRARTSPAVAEILAALGRDASVSIAIDPDPALAPDGWGVEADGTV